MIMIARAAVAFAVFATLAPAPDARAAPCAPEVDRICAGGDSIGYADLIGRLAAADIAVLGERHDNPVHHEWQARIVADLALAGLAFEMIPRALEAAANDARAAGEDPDGERLADALDWAESGWPDWSLYAPIFAAAPEARVTGGGLPVEALKAAIANGAAAAFETEVGERAARYRLDEPLGEETVAAMLDEQNRAHCGALPTAMLPGMAEAQQLRDAAFADAALRLVEAGDAPVALITGNGHARIDRGAPYYLARAAREVKVMSVGLIELAHGEDPAERPDKDLFDAVIFTKAHDRGDPCEAFVKSRESE